MEKRVALSVAAGLSFLLLGIVLGVMGASPAELLAGNILIGIGSAGPAYAVMSKAGVGDERAVYMSLTLGLWDSLLGMVLASHGLLIKAPIAGIFIIVLPGAYAYAVLRRW